MEPMAELLSFGSHPLGKDLGDVCRPLFCTGVLSAAALGGGSNMLGETSFMRGVLEASQDTQPDRGPA